MLSYWVHSLALATLSWLSTPLCGGYPPVSSSLPYRLFSILTTLWVSMSIFLRFPPPPPQLRLLPSLAVAASPAPLSLSHPTCTLPLRSSRATSSGRLLSLFLILVGLANCTGIGCGSSFVFWVPLFPSSASTSADSTLPAGCRLLLIPSSLPRFAL